MGGHWKNPFCKPNTGLSISQGFNKVCTLSLVTISTFPHWENFLVKTQEAVPSPAVVAGRGSQVTMFLATAVHAKWEWCLCSLEPQDTWKWPSVLWSAISLIRPSLMYYFKYKNETLPSLIIFRIREKLSRNIHFLGGNYQQQMVSWRTLKELRHEDWGQLKI